MLSQIQLERFRGFSRFSASFVGHVCLFKQCGKSTILMALRMEKMSSRGLPSREEADAEMPRRNWTMLTRFRWKTFRPLRRAFDTILGWRNPGSKSTEWGTEIRGNLAGRLGTSRRLRAARSLLFLHYANGGQPREPKEVRRLYPSLGVVPPLGPVDTSEPILSEKYVRANMGGRLSSRHFRINSFCSGSRTKLIILRFANESHLTCTRVAPASPAMAPDSTSV